MKITEPFTFAAVGDIIIRRPVGQLGDAGFQALTKVMRAADSTYANMEGPIIDEADPNYHGPQAGGPKTIIDDLKAMGIRVMTTANNHTMDGGSDGMFMTNRLLDEAKITHAGSGKDLTEARQAQVGITPKGTIGVVGMYSIDPSSNPGWTRYYDARDKWPGLNPLHVTPYNIVTADQMASLRKIRDASYAHRSEVTVPVAPVPANESPNELSLFGTRYKVGEKVGSLTYTIDRRDLDGIMRSIRVGKQNSDFMVVAIHAHQNSFSYQAYSHDNSTPDFLIELAHKAIDNGADVFVGHGVHTLRGVEIYKGKPIFYGVASFVQHEGPAIEVTDPSRPPVPQQNRQPDNREVLLTTSRYEGGKLVGGPPVPCRLRHRWNAARVESRRPDDAVAGAGPADPQARPGSVQAIRHDDLHRRQCRCDPCGANRLVSNSSIVSFPDDLADLLTTECVGTMIALTMLRYSKLTAIG